MPLRMLLPTVCSCHLTDVILAAIEKLGTEVSGQKSIVDLDTCSVFDSLLDNILLSGVVMKRLGRW